MINKSKLALVIQGPITSIGLTGNYFNQLLSTEQRNAKIVYNCYENVIEMAKNGMDYFDTVLIVTWSGELSESQCENLPSPYIMLKKPIEHATMSRRTNKESTYFGSKNLQLAALQFALESESLSACDYFIKVRSDQQLNVSQLLGAMANFIKHENDSRIMVPYLNMIHPDKFADFYFGANIDFMKRMLDHLQDNGEILPDFHRDMFYRLWEASLNRKLSVEEMDTIETEESVLKFEQFRRISVVSKSLFLPAGKDLWNTLSWRGVALKNQNLRGLAFEEKCTSTHMKMEICIFMRYCKYLVSQFCFAMAALPGKIGPVVSFTREGANNRGRWGNWFDIKR